jgi:hypothetical protein
MAGFIKVNNFVVKDINFLVPHDAIIRIYKSPPRVWNNLPRKISIFNNFR